MSEKPRSPEEEKMVLLEEARSGNSEAVHTIFEGNDEAVIREFKNFLIVEKGATPERVDLIHEMYRLRRDVVASAREQLQQRELKNSEPSKDELRLGTYIEGIESQVRHAILELQRKGYVTQSSGFGFDDYQSIQFEKGTFDSLDPTIVITLADKGVKIKSDNISFQVYTTDLQKIEQQWNEIVDLLPDRGVPAPASNTPAAISFRKKHEK